MIANLREQLRRDEGQRLKVYTDTVGVSTIGVGRNLQHKGISQLECDQMLSNDIAEYTIAVCKAIPWLGQLDEVRQEVLVNMAFNMGIAGLLQFKITLATIKRGDYNLAASQMLDSKWARQVGPRATRLAKQMQTGVRQ